MSLSYESRTSLRAAPRNRLPEVEPQRADRESRPSVATLYRVVWRWHFYAGLIVAPVLVVMAATGALYIFKDELERVMYARLMFVTPAESGVSIDAQVATAQAACPNGFHIDQLEIPADTTRATAVYIHDEAEFRTLFVDPYRGTLLGELGPGNFFDVVLKIHRTLFVGTLGRIVVELVTCWTIVLLVSGVYLWWPRKGRQVWGAWLPRLRRHPYVALRDLHAVCGFYAALVAIIIAATGLLYTYVWGRGYAYAAVQSGAYDVFLKPPKSESPAGAARLPLDQIAAIAGRELPGCTLGVSIPHAPDGAFVVFGTSPIGPSSDGVAIIDHATGKVLAQRDNSEYPLLGWWTSWNYPLHVGSILGLVTKVIWLAACIVLMLLPVTGVWMWWQRRPRGKSGFPRRPVVRVPRALVVGIIALGAVLPALGLSILALLLGEGLWSLARRRRATQAAS
ncbi:MAG: PepSY-associated TM helix domain-containing protein [Pirellulales bacterium]